MGGKRKPRYSGALNKPIALPVGILFESGSELQRQHLNREWNAKIRLLIEHYEINPSDPHRWQKLAIQLALDHVPGMQVVSQIKRGKGHFALPIFLRGPKGRQKRGRRSVDTARPSEPGARTPRRARTRA
jgi:hypothetical protein